MFVESCDNIFDLEMLFDSSLNQNVSSSQSKQHLDMKTNSTESSKTLFDSGVISENNLSTEISEIDINELSDKKTEEVPSTEISSEKKEVEEQMRLDSGIDIDLSDQFYSKSELCSEKNVKFDEKAENEKNEKNWKPVLSLDMIFQCDDEKNTTLHWAIMERYELLVRRILALIPYPNVLDVTNNYSQTCLHLSILTNQPKITRLLLLAGAKTNIEDRNGNTPLHLACKMNSYECVEALLTPITIHEEKYAVFKYSPEIDSPSRYLDEYNYDGVSCVHIAANNINFPILRQLLMYGADINIRECKAGFTVLHKAVNCGNIDLVRYILQHPGLDIEKINYARKTAYQLSCHFPNISRVLLEKGALRLIFVEDYSDEEYSDDESESDYEFNVSEIAVVDEVSRLMIF